MFPVIAARPCSFRRPRLVIAGGGGPAPAAQYRARRVIGKGGACHIRLMLLLPGVADPVRARHLIDRVVQPGVPFGGNLGPLRLALIDDPALLAAGPPAAPLQRLAATLAIIAVAKAVGPDQLAAEPRQQSRAERHRSIRAPCRYQSGPSIWHRRCRAVEGSLLASRDGRNLELHRKMFLAASAGNQQPRLSYGL